MTIQEPSEDGTRGMDEVEGLLLRAKEQERQYNWEEAGALYSKALRLVAETGVMRRGDIEESLGYSVHKHAFQAKTPAEFAKRIECAIEAYGKAEKTFDGLSDSAAKAKAARCRGMCEYLRFWLEPDAVSKRKRVDSAWNHAKGALETFLAMRDFAQLGKTCSDTFLAAVLSYDFEPIAAERNATLTDLTRYVSEAAEHVTEPRRLAENLVQLAGCLEASMFSLPHTVAQSESIIKRSRIAWSKAYEADEEAAILERTKADLLFGIEVSTRSSQDRTARYEHLFAVKDRLLVLARKTDDRLILGTAKSSKAGDMVWDTGPIEDPDEAKKAVEGIKRISDEARQEFETISFVSPDFLTGHWTSAPSSPWTSAMLSWREMDPVKKRPTALDGLERARGQLTFAQKSGYPYAVAGAHHNLGFLLGEVAKCEDNPKKKHALLREAIEHHNETVRAEDTFDQSHFWNRGTVRCHMAKTEAELGMMEGAKEDKIRLLRSSASHMKEGLALMERYPRESAEFPYDETALTLLGMLWLDYGRTLRHCWEQGKDSNDLESACAAFDRAADVQKEAGVLSRAAECFWEAAHSCHLAGEHLKASDRFNRAAESYKEASRKTKSLRAFFEDHALYMQGWSEVEKAAHHHSRQEAASSRDHFNNASTIHASTQRWRLLASNYSAWAQVENAEDLSQKEDSVASIDAFRSAAGLFLESRNSLQASFGAITCVDLKQMVAGLINATDNRRDLCEARAVLEAARLLDREGKMADAAERYGQGVEMLEKIRQRLTSSGEKKEIDLNLTLAKAWRAMAKAEAETSPELYQEAARLFEEAKGISPGERATNLAMGNSRFCRALEAGAKFEDTGDQTLYSAATDNLESAARYYMKAGQEKAAEYARASRLLFDAYVQMGSAIRESDHDKKAALYAIAVKILEESAASFDKASQPSKRAQIQKLLERVRKDRELAVSLTQVLRAPDIASATVAFSSPSHEAPVGLDRFEHADVQATMIVKPKDMHVGEELKLDIELVNAGKGPAQLTKVDGLVPSGFDVQTVPDRYRIEDSYLNMRGRRLSAMKTEDIKVVLKPTVHGTYVLKPRVLYLDESGKYKSFEPEPITVTVKELGITGWLKGPERTK